MKPFRTAVFLVLWVNLLAAFPALAWDDDALERVNGLYRREIADETRNLARLHRRCGGA